MIFDKFITKMEENPMLLKGELYHRERSQKYLYALDSEIGAIYCFKRKVNKIRSKVIILSNCEFLEYPSTCYLDCVLIEDSRYPSFDFIADGQTFAVIILEDQNIEDVVRQFKACALLPTPLMYRKCCRVFRGLGFIISIPFEISNVLCKGLETVGDKFNEAPEKLFKSPVKESKRFVPGNVASGLLVGTGKMLIGFAKGIGGLVYEPIKGAKESGFKGATKGIGKGILGLVCKSVAGAIDFVTLTVRGVNNTPSTMLKSAKKIYKKNQENREKSRQSVNIFELEDCAPGSNEIFRDNNDFEDFKIIEIPEINENEIQIFETEELILPILNRNQKLRQ